MDFVPLLIRYIITVHAIYLNTITFNGDGIKRANTVLRNHFTPLDHNRFTPDNLMNAKWCWKGLYLYLSHSKGLKYQIKRHFCDKLYDIKNLEKFACSIAQEICDDTKRALFESQETNQTFSVDCQGYDLDGTLIFEELQDTRVTWKKYQFCCNHIRFLFQSQGIWKKKYYAQGIVNFW